MAFIHVVLFIVGLLLLAFSIIAFFSRKLQPLTQIQKIKAFGFDLEVTTISLFFIISIVCMFTGVFIEWKNYQEKIQNYQKDIKTLENKLDETKKVNIRLTLNLPEDATCQTEDLREWQCTYYDRSLGNGTAFVEEGPHPGSFRITIIDVKPSTIIDRINLKHKDGEWIYDDEVGYAPLLPSVTLKKKR